MDCINMSYKFADYHLDLESRKLYRNNAVVSDDRKVVLLIQSLCQAYPDVVDKQLLISSLWPDQVVTDGSLSRLISSSRKLLGDNVREQNFIKTVRNKGFRFNSHVEKLKKKDSEKLYNHSPKSPKKYRLLIATTTIFIALLTSYMFMKPRQQNTLPEFPLRIAVLPVASKVQTKVNGWVKYGIMSLVSEQLGRYEALQALPVETIITSLAEIEQNNGKQLTPEGMFDAICERLGCSHLIVISFRSEEMNQAILSYQIISKNYSSPISEFKQAEVMNAAKVLLDSLAPALIPGKLEHLSLADTLSTNAKANRDYAIGVHELLAGEYASAKIYLNLAINKVPTFFWAKAYLAKVELKAGNVALADELLSQIKQTLLSEKQSYFLEHLRSDILYTKGNIAESLKISIQLLKNTYANTNPVLMGNELQNIGSSYLSLGNLQLANYYLTKALVQYNQAKFGSGKGKTLYNMGNVFLSSGEKQKSLDYYLKAKEIFIKYRLTGYTLMAKHMIASTSTSLGKVQYAERELRSLIEDYKKNGNLEGELRVLSDLIEISMKKNDNQEANIRNEILLKRLKSTEFSSLKNHTLAMGVICNIKLKNFQKAETYLNRINSEWHDIRPSFVLLRAYLQHEKGDLKGAVKEAKAIKLTLAGDWTKAHQMILDQFEKSLLANKILAISY